MEEKIILLILNIW